MPRYHRKLILFICILLLNISACSSIPKPDWVDTPSAQYPNDKYILGRGVGQTSTLAQNNARQNIANYFIKQGHQVQATAQTIEEIAEKTDDVHNMDLLTLLHQDHVMDSLKFVEQWVDNKTSVTHVLAVLPRTDVVKRLRSTVLALDELTYTFIHHSKKATDVMKQTGYADSAVKAQTKRAKLQQLLAIVDASGVGSPTSFNLKWLNKVRDILLNRIQLQLTILSDDLGELDDIVKNNLNHAGFLNVSNKPSMNQLNVALKLSQSKTDSKFSMNGYITTSIKLSSDKTIRGSHQWPINVTAKDQQTLILRSRESIDKQLKSDLREVLMSLMQIEAFNNDAFPE